MWRPVLGALLALMGVIWFFQGIDVLGGSGMSGHIIWSFLGVVLVIMAAYLVAGDRIRQKLGR
jgi:hypothetical protein